MSARVTAPATIPIRPARPVGDDPTTHYWFTSDGVVLRICDSTPWPAGQGQAGAGAFFVLCRVCKEMYVTDLARGSMAFMRDADSEVEIPREDTLVSGVYPPAFGVYSYGHGEEAMTIRVPMTSFARFYVARAHGKRRVVTQVWEQTRDTSRLAVR